MPGCAQHHKRCPVVSLSPLCDVQVLRGRGVVHAGLNLDELSSSDEEREIGAGGSRTSLCELRTSEAMLSRVAAAINCFLVHHLFCVGNPCGGDVTVPGLDPRLFHSCRCMPSLPCTLPCMLFTPRTLPFHVFHGCLCVP